MKTSFLLVAAGNALKFYRQALLLTVLIFLTQTAPAAVTYWDADGISDANYGGDGTWNSTNINWAPDTTGTGADAAWVAANTANFLRGTAGTVTLGSAQSAAAFSLGVNGTAGSGNYTFNGSKLTLTPGTGTVLTVGNGSTATFNNAVDVGAGVVISAATGNGNTLNFNGGLTSATAGALTIIATTNSFVNITNMTKATGTVTVGGTSGTSSGNYAFSGTGTMTGAFTINRGNVILNSDTALGSASSLIFLGSVATAETGTLLIGTSGVTIDRTITLGTGANATGDTRVIGSNISSGTATYSGGVTLAETNLSLRADAGGTTVFSGVLSDGAETRGISKTGAGVVKLANANTYDGNTAVTTGTLLINNTTGSGTGSGNITVAANATLGGTGSVSGSITVSAGGRVSAGDMTAGVSTGDSFDGTSLTLSTNDSTASMLFDLGTTSDVLTLAGAFTKGTGSNFIVNFEDAGGLAIGTYTLVNFGSTTFSLSDFSAISSISGFSGTFSLDADSLDFTVAAIPEPSTYALLGMGLGSLVLLRRKKNNV